MYIFFFIKNDENLLLSKYSIIIDTIDRLGWWSVIRGACRRRRSFPGKVETVVEMCEVFIYSKSTTHQQMCKVGTTQT